jgi:ATP-dependent Clp protease ATP-binding subunit ClpA
MRQLPNVWFSNLVVWWPRLFKNLAVFLDNKLAFSVNLIFWLVPMWQDKSLLGRTLSLLVRTAKISFGLVVMGLTLGAAAIWFCLWLLLTPLWILLWPIDLIRQLVAGRSNLNPEVKKIVNRSHNLTDSFKQQLLKNKTAVNFLTRLEIAPEAFANLTFPLTVTAWLKLAQPLPTARVEIEDLILAVLKLNRWRYQSGLTALNWIKKAAAWARTPFLWEKDYVIRPIGGVDRGLIGLPTPTLDRYATDLTKAALKHQLPEIIGKDKALFQLIKILSRRGKHHGLIIGEPGSGKTTLIKGLAQEIVRGVTATALRFKRLVALDLNRLTAGVDEAELTQLIEQILDEITAAKNIILFVDEAHHLAIINQETPESSNLFRALEPALDEGRLQFIGATTTENYRKYIAPNEAFSRLMEIIELPEASPATSETLLEYLAWQREQSERVIVTRPAISRSVELAERYFHDRVLPDKAVNLLDEAIAQVTTAGGRLITSLTIDRLVSDKVKVPVSQIETKEAKALLNLETKLHQRVIGQETAIRAIAQALRRARTQIKDPKKPIAGFLFAGPTGVGKTETAKALAAEFFGNEKVMIRLDMSEFQTIPSVDRLLEQLTEAVRRQPYTLILLDEVEKAHKKIINLFLSVLDDARLTDLSGKTADFSNTIIIATTNAKDLKQTFAPEWLNRFNAIITFSSLTPAQMTTIIKLKLKHLSQNLLRQEILMEFTPETVKTLAREAFSDDWGGRQANRVIQNRVENVIAEKILAGEIVKNQLYRFSL